MDDIPAIHAKAAGLADDIRNSDLYSNYKTALGNLKHDPRSIEKISFFKKENISYRTKVFQNGASSFDEEKYISGLYAELMLNKSCGEFLEAENKLLELLTDVLDTISEGVEMEFEVFE